MRVPFVLHSGDRLVLQYPLKKYFVILCKIAHFKKSKVIVVIHDLGSFRRKKLTPEQEIKRLNNADYIIAHNGTMKQWLENNGCRLPVGELGIFDYLSDSQGVTGQQLAYPYKVVYAGGLNYRKNKFLYEIGDYIKSYALYLYGAGFELEKAKGESHFTYKGFVPSDQLISSVEGDFGLVWDGTSIEKCTGDFGEYLRYNNPHKTSLYLRCGLPVIIWKEAALAPFVESNGVGFSVDSLADIDSLLESLSADKYFQMKENAVQIGQKLQEGYFTLEALLKANENLGRQES